MLNLSVDDQSRLVEILAEQPSFQTSASRMALLRDAGLMRIVPTLSLELPTPQLIAGQLIYDLCTRGRTALGNFLGALARRIYDEEAPELPFIHQILLTYQLPLPHYGRIIDPRVQLEHATHPGAFLPVTFLESAIQTSRAVALVKLAEKNRVGSSFLVGRSLFLTNHHVLENRVQAEHAIFRFNYQLTLDQQEATACDYRMKPGGHFVTNETYDYTFVELVEVPGDVWGFLRLHKDMPAKELDPINIIQHPGGGYKQVACTISNVLIKVEATELLYTTATESGSSGSPVCTNDWQVIALHASGRPAMAQNRLYSENHGIRIDVILHALKNDSVLSLINQ